MKKNTDKLEVEWRFWAWQWGQWVSSALRDAGVDTEVKR